VDYSDKKMLYYPEEDSIQYHCEKEKANVEELKLRSKKSRDAAIVQIIKMFSWFIEAMRFLRNS
jgi:hypothetical protein